MKQDYSREISLSTIFGSLKLNLRLISLTLLPALIFITLLLVFLDHRQLAKYTTTGTLQIDNSNPLTYSGLPNLDPTDNSLSLPNTSQLATNSETIVSLISTEYILEKIVKENHLDLDIKVIKNDSTLSKLKSLFKPKPPVIYPEITMFDVGHNLYNRQLTLVFKSKSQFDIFDNKNKLVSGMVGSATAIGNQITVKIDSYGGDVGAKFAIVKSSTDAVVDNLQKRLKIDPVIIMKKASQSDTGIINISITDFNAKKQADLINNIMEEVKIKSWERQRQNLKQSIEFIENQATMAKNSLDNVQESLVQLQSSHKIIDLDTQARTDILTSTDLDLKVMEKSIAINQYEKLYTNSHPLMIGLRQQRDELIKKRDAVLARLDQLPEDQAMYAKLKSNLDVQQQLYILLLGKEQNLKIKFFGITSPVEILSYATDNVAPILVPLSVKVIASYLMILFVLESIVIMYFTIWNTGDPNLLPSWLDCQMLAIFPYLRSKRKGVDYTHPSFNVIYAYFLSELNKSANGKVVCNFGSIKSFSGKSFLIKAISDYFAEQGKRTLHITFSQDANALNIANILESKEFLNKSQALKVSLKISIVKQLDLDAFNLLLQQLENFDFILMESPSIIESPSFMNLSKIVDQNIVVAIPYDTVSQIERITNDFANLDVKIDRVIFNHSRKPFLNSIYSVNKVK